MTTTPTRTAVTAFHVVGLTVRTCNRDEMDPATARIGALWDRFFSQSWERTLPSRGEKAVPQGADAGGGGVPLVAVAGAYRQSYNVERSHRSAGRGGCHGRAPLSVGLGMLQPGC